MAKCMARVANGNVINIEWCSDRATETASLKETHGIHVAVGDRYEDGAYYRNGERLLSTEERMADMEAALADAEAVGAQAMYETMLADMDAAYREGVASA